MYLGQVITEQGVVMPSGQVVVPSRPQSGYVLTEQGIMTPDGRIIPYTTPPTAEEISAATGGPYAVPRAAGLSPYALAVGGLVVGGALLLGSVFRGRRR